MRLTQTHTRRALTFGATFKLIKGWHVLFFAGLASAALLMAGPGVKLLRPAKADAICVNPGGTGGCFATIQAAVNAADATAATDVITVAAGTYAEAVTIPATEPGLTINGPNANINACTGARVAEAVVGNATGAFNITANNVVVSGFTLSGNTSGAFFGFSVIIGANTSGVQLLNNIITNNIAGVALGGDNSTIRGNKFLSNNNPGPVSGTAIYSDQFITGNALTNITIDNNCFTTNNNVAILIGSTNSALGASGIAISNNTFTTNGNAVLLFNTTASSITRNTISSSIGSQVVLGGGVNGLQITENFIINGASRAIRIGDFGGGGTNSNILINCNHIQGNPTAGLAIEAAAGSYTGTLNAEMVWWGSPTGPTNPGNPGGTGQPIIDPGNQVDFTPFLTSGADGDPATAGFQCPACMLSCPTNVNVGVQQGQASTTVNYALPTSNGACGPVVCSPPSGSTFNVGSTVVTCRAPNSTACNLAYGLTTGNALVSFDVATPGTVSAPVATQGLGAGENIVGIDFRPANGTLYGVAVVGTTARVLTINPVTGVTTQVGATFPVTGSFFGVDFNPVPDRLRVVSDTDINLRINPDTGAVVTDGTLNPSDPRVVAAAYSNNFAGATTTTLYTIDSGLDLLNTQNPPNAGTQIPVGGVLGVATAENVGFDISQCNGIAYASLTAVNTSSLYTINLGTGAATLVGGIGSGLELRGLALALAPPATQTTCSFNVTVNPISFSVTDPIACTGPGNAVTGTFTIPNLSAVPVTVTATVALPTGLLAVPGSCIANTGTCSVVTSSSVTFSGTIGAGQTATVSYTAQVGDLIQAGTISCTNLTVSYGNPPGPALSVQACITATCPAPGPGQLFPAASEMSDQKAGSVLIYNVYTSGATSGNTQNTRINVTNINPTLPAFVHLFFVAEGCAVADSYICLTGNQTASFLASDLDPGTTGYIVALAVDAIGCPTNFNYLIGDEYVKFSSGHASNLGAEAFAAIPGGLPLCNSNSVTASINFDGVSYNRAPRTVALSSVGSRADGNDTLLILNRIGGNLGIGASTLSAIFGIFYDDAENSLSFSVAGNCQLRSSLSNNFPRITPRFETFIPAGRTGWLKLFSQSDIGITGAAINFNANAASSAGAFNQGHNLHTLTTTSAASYVIPVFPPSC